MDLKNFILEGIPCAVRRSDGAVFTISRHGQDVYSWILTDDDGRTLVVPRRSDEYKFVNIDKVPSARTMRVVSIEKPNGTEQFFNSWDDALFSETAHEFFGFVIKRVECDDIFKIMLEDAIEFGVTDSWRKSMEYLADEVYSFEYNYTYVIDGERFFITDDELDREYAVKQLCKRLGYTAEEKLVYRSSV